MAKNKIVFICENCEFRPDQWLGRCPGCGEWNSLLEQREDSSKDKLPQSDDPQKISEIKISDYKRMISGINEFDRVMGGGAVVGSLSLIGGDPGVGKSTLLTHLAGSFCQRNEDSKIIYISGEESLSQIAGRNKRLGINYENLYLYNETEWSTIESKLKKLKPIFIVIDSIQTIVSADINAAAGSITQVREVTHEIMNFIKATDITCIIIGHINKEGAIAGPKVLEHMVDTVIYFEGEKDSNIRLLRVIKNRFGPTHEVGHFQMKSGGLYEITNNLEMFIDKSGSAEFGASLSCFMEGSRLLIVETQALVVENKYGNGQRISQGIDRNRLSMLVAIIEKYLNITLSHYDIFINIVGGMKLFGRESDLSIIASIMSSYQSRKLNHKSLFFGEVGLTGEVRTSLNMKEKMPEVYKFGYKNIITSKKFKDELGVYDSDKVLAVGNIQEFKDMIL